MSRAIKLAESLSNVLTDDIDNFVDSLSDEEVEECLTNQDQFESLITANELDTNRYQIGSKHKNKNLSKATKSGRKNRTALARMIKSRRAIIQRNNRGASGRYRSGVKNAGRNEVTH